MLYHWFELGHAAVKPARLAAGSYRLMMNNPFNPLANTAMGRSASAACEVFERSTRRYTKPEFRITETIVDGNAVAVREDVVWEHPFCELIHFSKAIPQKRARQQPRVLLFAPMSGHFATLLRGTIEAFLPDHDVYITDWRDARQVPVTFGRFDLDDYIDVVRDMLTALRGDVHVVAVCQPSVPVLAAIALMEAADNPHAPNSLTLLGGPVDTRVSPTAVNQLAEDKGTDWFANNVIMRVPWPHLGFGRSVYPGFLQLGGFMTMNLDRHVKAHKDLFKHLVEGDGDGAGKHKEFYDEYLAVMDLTSEFYLQTIETVFVGHHLPKGEMTHRGKPVELDAIRNVPLLTVEGEKDDITGKGQCAATLELCGGLKSKQKDHYEVPLVGHYGIFNGSRFRRTIVPRLTAFFAENEPPKRVRETRAVPVDIDTEVVPSEALTCAKRVQSETQRALAAVENGELPAITWPSVVSLASAKGTAVPRRRKKPRKPQTARSRRS